MGRGRLASRARSFPRWLRQKGLRGGWGGALCRPALFQSPGLRRGSTWIGVLLYAVQIYCDFSGYTDMAIAVAGLLGYSLTINFNFPYFASSITDFWRRWHISLSSWLRDYLYISLGGNRGSILFAYRNILFTMLLGGLWHGASWVFVLWGGLARRGSHDKSAMGAPVGTAKGWFQAPARFSSSGLSTSARLCSPSTSFVFAGYFSGRSI